MTLSGERDPRKTEYLDGSRSVPRGDSGFVHEGCPVLDEREQGKK